MNLEEIFKKYSDETRIKRPCHMFTYNIKWAKGLKAWGNQESRDTGFIIPQFMIEDANAEDWEIIQ